MINYYTKKKEAKPTALKPTTLHQLINLLQLKLKKQKKNLYTNYNFSIFTRKLKTKRKNHNKHTIMKKRRRKIKNLLLPAYVHGTRVISSQHNKTKEKQFNKKKTQQSPTIQHT